MHQPQARKVPIPRKLDINESAPSIRLWKIAFINYYRSDIYFSKFVQAGAKWNVNAPDWGFTDEPDTSDLKRTKAQLKEDCKMFLETLASYVPDDYLVEKISKTTEDMDGVWTILEQYYGISINSDTFLQIDKMQKKDVESYRQFYLRMEGMVSKHLTKGNVKVEDVTSPADGDTMSITLKNLVVIMWLQKISPKMVDCVRHEYAQELRDGKQLVELMGRISENVESILSKHDVANTIAQVQSEDGGGDSMHTVARVDAPYRGGGRSGRGGGRGGRPGGQQRQQYKQGGKELKCAHCEYLSQTLRLRINTNHEPTECFRKDIAVRLIAMEDGDTSLESVEDLGKLEHEDIKPYNDTFSFQTDPGQDHQLGPPEDPPPVPVPAPPSLHESHPPILSDKLTQDLSVLRVQQRLLEEETKPAHARSPALEVIINDVDVTAVIDEGAEMSVCSLKLTKKCHLRIIPTKHSARAADSSRLRVVGKLANPLVLVTKTHGICLTLTHVTVVEALSTDLLIGEPGKMENKIITIPFDRLIQLEFRGKHYTIPYAVKQPVSRVARVTHSQTISPGETMFWKVPAQYLKHDRLDIQPRREDRDWFPAQIRIIEDGYIKIKNTSSDNIFLKRNQCFGEIRMVEATDISTETDGDITKEPEETDTGIAASVTDTGDNNIDRVFSSYPDQQQYVAHDNPELKKRSYTDQVALDPDNILSPGDKRKFRELIESYSDIIRPEPGRYNGRLGHIDNSINFTTRPPPNRKIYHQKLTEEQKRILGEKMDKMMSWGVLAYPEQVGVRVEFISPSMLRPKQEKNEFRMVTDLVGLNQFIKPPPASHPTIKEARDALAKANYHIHLDLSNWFYQSGMDRKDIQFLGTVHPSKGVVVYTVEPQGLAGASEHAYEKLARIYGPLIAAGKLTRMADGLHVLANTIEDGYETLSEVFRLARFCGLHFKPTKIEIFPRRTVLFGWNLVDHAWTPTAHNISSLYKAPLPKTVKQMRAFLGSFKQFAACVRRHGELLSTLERLVGSHKPSAEVIQYTPEEEKAFYAARDATIKIEAFTVPRPSDRLFTYSDYSKDHRAVGGKLEFERTMPDGTIKRFLGGYFSVMVDSMRTAWYPCEGEGLGIRLVLAFWEHYIRENEHTTIHFSDNQPCVDAWKRSKRGAFSSNARIATFLSQVGSLKVEIRHKAGSKMETSDYASRNPQQCPDKTCVICKFAYEQQLIGDNCDQIRAITVEEVTSGKIQMPCTQKRAWLDTQSNDPVHVKLKYLIEVGQAPAKKKTKGDFNKLKLLHNLYRAGDLKIDKEGLVMVRQHGPDKSGWVISIPHRIFPGLASALHLKFNHPSRHQLTMLMQRYFYSPGYQGIIGLITDNCAQCQSMKSLPKTLTEFTTTPLGNLGTKFSTDVMQRANQAFLITVEDLSGFTWIDEIKDQTASTLKDTLLSQILAITPEQGAVVRTDGASSFQTLANEANTPGTVWAKHSILLEIGDKMNVNRNPVAENKIREIHKEFLRHSPDGGKMTQVQLTEIAKSVNARIRSAGLASREILLSRALLNNQKMDLADTELSNKKTALREYNNSAAVKHQKKAGAEKADKHNFEVGDLVLLNTPREKTKSRDQFIIHSMDTARNIAVVRKAQSQLQAKTYPVDLSLLIPLNYFRPGPQISADMSKTEMPEGKTEEKEDEKEKETKIEKEKKPSRKKKKEKKLASNSEKETLTSGNVKGAPVKLNAAGRPQRKAAAQAYKAWIQSVSCHDDIIKPPWLQEDQPDEDDISISDPRNRYPRAPGIQQVASDLEDSDSEPEADIIEDEAAATDQVETADGQNDSNIMNEAVGHPVSSDSEDEWTDTESGQQSASPEAASNEAQSAKVKPSPTFQDKSSPPDQPQPVAHQHQHSDINNPSTTLHSSVVSKKAAQPPPRPLQRVQLGPGAPAQDLTEALASLAVGPPPPPRRQGAQAEERHVRQNPRLQGKPRPDYNKLDKFGKGGQ